MAVSAASGALIDVQGIVSQLMTIERQPLTKLTSEISGVDSKISVWGKVQSALSTLRDATRALYQFDSWSASTASSGDTAKVAASGGQAATGSYAVSVGALARSQSVVSRTFAANDTVVGGGTLSIQMGSLSGDGSGFSADAGRPAVTIEIAADATLADIRNAINASGAGVSASIVNDGSGRRLALTSRETGLAQAFEITVADLDGNDGDDAGLSAFAVSPTAASGGNGTLRTQLAADARFTVNGLDVVSGTNKVTDAIEGVTLDLKQLTDSPVTVDVGSDTKAHAERIEAFVSAYNAANSLLTSLTKYDAASKTAGALQGNSTAVRIQQQLRELVRTNPGADANSTLSSAGFNIARDGSLSIKDDAKQALVADPERMKTLFGGRRVDGEYSGGVARTLGTALAGFLGTDGALTSATDTLRNQRSTLEGRQTRLEGRLEDIEARLTRQYTTLDANLSKLQNSFSAVQSLLNQSF